MDSYSQLLEKIRIPQPSLQKFAVISIFDKLRSAPTYLNPDSAPGTDAITQCLHSTSASVLDQSVRELCRLVRDSKLDLSRGLLELQSALEASDSRFVSLFVKGIGFLVRLGFQNNSLPSLSSENHPFVKVLSCRVEVQTELVQQVLIFIMQSKNSGMVEVCDFLLPFLNYSIVRMPSSVSVSSFIRSLVSSLAGLCCSIPLEAIPVIKLLIGRLKFFPCDNAEDFTNISHCLECIVDAYVVVLQQLVEMGSQLLHQVQLCGVELLDVMFSLCTNPKHTSSIENILEVSRRILIVQKDLGLSFIPELSTITLSLFMVLMQSELEHEQFLEVKLVLFLLKWKHENENDVFRDAYDLNEELLFIFPAISLLSSPSKSVKQLATDLLHILGKLSSKLLIAQKTGQPKGMKFPTISTPKYIVFRLLQHIWLQELSPLSGSFYLNYEPSHVTSIRDEHYVSKTWSSLVTDHLHHIIARRKSSSISQSQNIFLIDMPMILSAIACVLVMHQADGSSSVDILANSSRADPKLGVPLLLVIQFYNHIFSTNTSVDSHGVLLKLLELLPSLASHPAIIPLVIQTLLPMLQNDKKPVLFATAIRLLCKTWEYNDRVFGTLQGVLLANRFTRFASKRDICISMAVSICDICRRNPDRGVDLILSIAACVENQDPLVQSLGLQSLGHLCEADAIDFYSAWDVIAKHVLNYSANAMVAHSLCLLLNWGAMDAQAYPEASVDVLKILWNIGTSQDCRQASLWSKARASAFVALTSYEVEHLERSIPDFKDRNLEYLVSETDPEVLTALEGFEVKLITFEHITRRRLVKQKKVSGNKIEKLLDVFPRLIFASGKERREKELPGAALFCLPFTKKDSRKPGASEDLQDVQAKYEASLIDIATSLQLSRNILISILSLQSWKPFMRRWMRAYVLLLDAKLQTAVLDKTPKAAMEILKSMTAIAERSLPRSAENIALAVGALCSVLPASAHAVKATASKFLLDWLFQHEHEYRQWSAAISLGLISSCLHLTDHKQKFENINALLEVASVSKSTLVKGACGVGLGYSCQTLLARAAAHPGKETHKIEEAELLRKIIRTLSQMISQFTPSSADVLETLSVSFPLRSDNLNSNFAGEFLGSMSENLEEDVWGVAGLVLGLGNCVGAMYRAGMYDAVLNVKALLISWIPHPSEVTTMSKDHEILLFVGSCLAVPTVMATCQRFELIDDAELEHLLSCYKELISELLSIKRFDTFHQSLLMASCLGAGSLVGVVLNEGSHSLKIEHIKELLALFRKSYADSNPPLIYLGAMLGVVNALGAGAGTLIEPHPLSSSHSSSDQKEASYISGPLITNDVLEPDLTSLVQEMFLVAQNSDAHQLQQHAAWAISFLRHYLWVKDLQNDESTSENDSVGSKTVSQNFPEDSTVMKLSMWLMHLNYLGTGDVSHVNTVSSVLRCLSHASRLPPLDWGAIIRRCMRYESRVAGLLAQDITFERGNLREECLLFSLSHANQFDPLLSFLDELCDIPRLRVLESRLQFFLLSHLADLVKIFSGSRIVKLFEDVAELLSWSTCPESCDPLEKITFRISCWRGLQLCLDESSHHTQDYKSSMEKCMEFLFTLLPSAQTDESCQVKIFEEWSEALRCLEKAQQGWLLDLLKVSEVNFTVANSLSFETVKKIQAIAKLVQSGSLPLTVLGKLKACLLDSRSQDIWDALTEVSITVQHAEGNAKRQWLIEALEISCITRFPSTALQFVGLLCGSCCIYRPVLIVDKFTVLSDLPVTLTSLLSDSSWMVVADSVVSYLWASTERIYEWNKQLKGGFDTQSIDKSENDIACFLLLVMYQACVSLKDHLPSEKQLQLANMVVPANMDVHAFQARLNFDMKSLPLL
ncbi:protein RST1 isoform X1 [Solanum lycopersicum]|uniref:protein RST1 isoform X1 n=1 Tax=Solanum lycopersicum TaxID=4081 RepID=UPI000532B669|nr:protein RST1 isoform X1 [Solanum lycopersicum]